MKRKPPQLIPRIAKILAQNTKYMEEPVVEQVARHYRPFEVLISTMLSVRTKDTTTTLASKRLFSLVKSPQDLLRLSTKRLEKLIHPVGFFKTKARHLKKAAAMLIRRYNGRVPGTREELLTLPGVGRKVANLVLSLSFGVPAICVDTHVHRISNRLGLIQTKTPEETEYALMKILPQKYWQDWNAWLVMWGQNICTPVSPHCSTCPLLPLCERRNVTSSR